MDLSKAFDSLNHGLLLAKLEACSVDNNAASFMRSYLTNRLRGWKISNSFSEWTKISAGFLQESILGLLLFNIFISDILFLQKCDLANYADDSTTYTSEKRVSTIIDSLSHELTILCEWFYNNFMILDRHKCPFMLLCVDNSLQTNLVCNKKTETNVRCNTKQ